MAPTTLIQSSFSLGKSYSSHLELRLSHSLAIVLSLLAIKKLCSHRSLLFLIQCKRIPSTINNHMAGCPLLPSEVRLFNLFLGVSLTGRLTRSTVL